MKLIIGGYAQGKLKYALTKNSLHTNVVFDKTIPQQEEIKEPKVIINHFHDWVNSSLRNDGCPEEEIRKLLEYAPECIIISDEIGNGIVPMEKTERVYRERLGRILIELADKAEEVERVICGIGQKIK